MDINNIVDIRKVLVVMKFAADALRRLHNDSEPEDVHAAHAEHDAALLLFNQLVQSYRDALRKAHQAVA